MTGVSVIGLGKLGACMAACFSASGHKTTGADLNAETVETLNSGVSPTPEPGLEKELALGGSNFSATTDVQAAVAASSITFIVTPTPSNPDSSFSAASVLSAAEDIGNAIAEKSEFHVVVLTSTVHPGTTVNQLIPALEKFSGKKIGVGFGVCYSPEFIALGSVINDLRNPDFILLGVSDQQTGDIAEQVISSLTVSKPPVRRMGIVNAELAKLAINTYVTTKITYANIISEICERLPGGDASEVLTAIGSDRRIGSMFLKGGLGYGGPCFPRDNPAMAWVAETAGVSPDLFRGVHVYNASVVDRYVRQISNSAPTGSTVAVLGMAYKRDTHVLDESQGLQIAIALNAMGYDVKAYDPAAGSTAPVSVTEKVCVVDSLDSALSGAAVTLIANWDPAFTNIPAEKWTKTDRPIVFDPWRICETSLSGESHFDYRPGGVHLTK